MKGWIESLGYALVLALLSVVASHLARLEPFQVFALEQFLGNGVELNDIHYQFHRGNSREAVPSMHEVVVINSEPLGDLRSQAQFRQQLAALMDSIQPFQPLAVGLDFIFLPLTGDASEELQSATAELEGVLATTPNVVLAMDVTVPSPTTQLVVDSENSGYGVINFEDSGRVAIRKYVTRWEVKGEEHPSFALALASKRQPELLSGSSLPEEFPLHYMPHGALVTSVSATDEALRYGKTRGIPVLQGDDVLKHPERYAAWLRQKVVLIGHASNDNFNIEDKHRVPCDSVLFNRLPTCPGPVVHATAVHNMLNHATLGWRYVPKWIITLSTLVLLVFLVHLILFTRLGKSLNFVFLAVMSIPLLYLGFLLMEWGWYWPMTSTILPLIFIEEILEVVHPWVEKAKSLAMRFNTSDPKKPAGTSASAVVLLMLSLAPSAVAQTMSVRVLEGQATMGGFEYSPELHDMFLMHDGDSVRFEPGIKGLVEDDQTGIILMWDKAGWYAFQQLKEEVNREPPSLMESFVRAFFFEGVVSQEFEQNKGVAYRGGGQGVAFLPADESVVAGDSLWIGAAVPEGDGAPWVVHLFDEAGTWEEHWETDQGGVWAKCPPPGVYSWAVSTYGIEVGQGTFRVATEEEVSGIDAFMSRVLDSCPSCAPSLLDSVQSNVLQGLPFQRLKPR